MKVSNHNYHHLVREWCKTIVSVVKTLHVVGKVVEWIVKLSDLVSFYSTRLIFQEMFSYPRWRHKYQLKPGVWIFEPTEESIRIGKEIKNAVQEKWTIPQNYYHLRQGGHIAALKLHKSDTCFAHLDISKFFNTINRSRLTRSLKLFFDYSTSRNYSLLSTVKLPDQLPIMYILPYGFVQSPILASLCLRQSALGRKIENLSNSEFVRTSVYMDDIIISGADNERLEAVVTEIKTAANKSAFTLNTKKEEGPASAITAFNIIVTTNKTSIIPKRYNELRNNYNLTKNRHVKHGIATYVSTVNSKQLVKLDSRI